MTRTEKLLAELIALPSVNPAFATQVVASTRQAFPKKFGEKNVADVLAATAARAGLEVEFQKVLPGRPNLIVRLLPRNNIRRTILLAPHLDRRLVERAHRATSAAEVRQMFADVTLPQR